MAVNARLLDRASIQREQVRRGGLPEFVRKAWHILEPSTPLKWSWHLDAVCQHVEAVLKGEIHRLLIAIPPGTAKSLVTTVFAPAYQWGPGERPDFRTICASYSGALSSRDSVRCRRLIESPWYQERWPIRLTTDQNTKTRFENDRTGFRVSTSVGGTVTGDRGNLVVCDDLLDIRRAESPVHREEASQFFWETLPSRVNDVERDSFIVIAQRLHQADTIGEILDRAPGRWEQLVLPMEFEPGRRCVTVLGFKDPRTEEGQVLHPERFPAAVLENMKVEMGTYAWAAQYQQRPSPRGGGMVRDEWLAKRFTEPGAKPTFILQTWDTGIKPKERNDPSCGLTLAVFQDRVELWRRWYGRKEFPDLLRAVKDEHAAVPGVNAVLIEDKGSGQQLLQQLRRDTKIPLVAIEPEQDKVTRMAAETPFLEAGKLWLPDAEPWVSEYVTELTTFPKAPHDDQVDATSQALKWLRMKKFGPKRVLIPGSFERESPNIV